MYGVDNCQGMSITVEATKDLPKYSTRLPAEGGRALSASQLEANTLVGVLI